MDKHPPPLRPLACDSQETREVTLDAIWVCHDLEVKCLFVGNPILDPLDRAFLVRYMQRIMDAIDKAHPPLYVNITRSVMLAAREEKIPTLTMIESLSDGSRLAAWSAGLCTEGDPPIDPDLFQRAIALWKLGPGKRATKKDPDKDVWEVIRQLSVKVDPGTPSKDAIERECRRWGMAP